MSKPSEPSQAVVVNDAGEALPVARPNQVTDVLSLLQSAVDKGMPVEVLEKLVGLKERIDAAAARSAFNAALAAFQSECPNVPKSSRAAFATKSGGRAEYQYAELEQYKRTLGPVLQKHGLSYSWSSEVTDRWMNVTCTLRHVAGHSETASFPCPIEGSALMSEPQKHAATLTFGMRQSLRQVAGITTGEPDDDGASGAREVAITEAQAAELTQLLNDGGPPLGTFYNVFHIKDVSELPARKFDEAVKRVAAFKAKAATKGAKP